MAREYTASSATVTSAFMGAYRCRQDNDCSERDPVLHRQVPQHRAKSMTAPRRWTGWSKEQERGITITSAATTTFWERTEDGATAEGTLGQQVPPEHHRHAGPRGFHHRGRTLAGGSRRRGCACWTPMPASSRRPKRSGVRPTATRFRASSSSTRWTRSAPTSSNCVQP